MSMTLLDGQIFPMALFFWEALDGIFAAILVLVIITNDMSVTHECSFGCPVLLNLSLSLFD